MLGSPAVYYVGLGTPCDRTYIGPPAIQYGLSACPCSCLGRQKSFLSHAVCAQSPAVICSDSLQRSSPCGYQYQQLVLHNYIHNLLINLSSSEYHCLLCWPDRSKWMAAFHPLGCHHGDYLDYPGSFWTALPWLTLRIGHLHSRSAFSQRLAGSVSLLTVSLTYS